MSARGLRALAALAWTALALSALFVPALLFAPPAAAHAVLIGSDPIDGSRLADSPDQVTLTFDEPVRLVQRAVRVIGDDGIRVDTGSGLRPDGRTVVITLAPALPTGSYTAVWRVVSADSHEVSGSVSFGVRQQAHAVPGPVATRDGVADATAAVAAAAVYAGVVLVAGVVVVCGLLWPAALGEHRVRAMVWAGWLLVVVATLVQFGTLVARGVGAGVLTERSGVVLELRMLVMVVMAVAVRSALGRGRGGAPVYAAATGLAVTVAGYGHAAVGPLGRAAVVVTTGHVLAMSIWLGGLTVLATAAVPSPQPGDLRRWSKVALGCVSVLVLTGVFQAWRQVFPLASLWSTDYGRVLIVKVAAVCVMVAAAYWARRHLASTALRRGVAAEAALGLGVLALTSVLTSLPPARTDYGPAAVVAAELPGGRTAEVRIGSTHRGPTSFDVVILGPGGRPVPAESLTATLSGGDADIASLPVGFAAGPQGSWRSTYATVPLPGRWTLNVVVDFGPADAASASVPFRVW